MSKGKGKFFLGALAGAVAGAVAGLLLAPKKGSETRKIIKDEIKDYAEKGKDLAVKEAEAVKDSVEKTAKDILK